MSFAVTLSIILKRPFSLIFASNSLHWVRENPSKHLTPSVIKLVRTIDADFIRHEYIKQYGYDPKAELDGVDKLSLYECVETGLKFFMPLSTVGQEALYKQLQTFDWNYKETKWEHDEALKFVHAKSRLLDVGCGQAAFLNRAAETKAAIVTGLEFNESAADFGRERGVEVFTDTIQTHADLRPNYYDTVASFQVFRTRD